MLNIADLHAEVEGTPILNGEDLHVGPGQVHCLMGPNGSGKSTLAQVLAGRDRFEVTHGMVRFRGDDLLAMEPHERARAGLFLAFQYPVEIPGLSGLEFLQSSLNAVRRARGQSSLDAMDFAAFYDQRVTESTISRQVLDRSVNDGFSGGERKRSELIQMALLEPKLAVLDELDSGLDVEGLRLIAGAVSGLRANGSSVLLITHYFKLFDVIEPDAVHVFCRGRVAETGTRELAARVEREGYDWTLPGDLVEPAKNLDNGGMRV